MTITIAERIKNFLTEHEGTPYCDNCIAGQLEVNAASAGPAGNFGIREYGQFPQRKGTLLRVQQRQTGSQIFKVAHYQ